MFLTVTVGLCHICVPFFAFTARPVISSFCTYQLIWFIIGCLTWITWRPVAICGTFILSIFVLSSNFTDNRSDTRYKLTRSSSYNRANSSGIHAFSRGFHVGFILLSLLFSVYCLVDHSLFFVFFSFGNCIVCYFSIYSFWLCHWYLQHICLIYLWYIA
jgi:hypothetical protein